MVTGMKADKIQNNFQMVTYGPKFVTFLKPSLRATDINNSGDRQSIIGGTDINNRGEGQSIIGGTDSQYSGD